MLITFNSKLEKKVLNLYRLFTMKILKEIPFSTLPIVTFVTSGQAFVLGGYFFMNKDIKLIPNQTIYYCCRLGNIYSTKTGKLKQLKQDNIRGDKGYKRVKLYIGHTKKKILVHRLVALTFIPNPDNKYFVNHINGTKTDNRIENLEWVTASENLTHSYSKLLRTLPNRKFDDNEIYRIRLGYLKGVSQVELAKEFKTTSTKISQIITKKIYKYV